MKQALILVMFMILFGCAIPAAPRPVCPVVLDLPPQVMDRIADEIEAMPPGAYTRELVVPDWIRMRDEARAICGMEKLHASD